MIRLPQLALSVWRSVTEAWTDRNQEQEVDCPITDTKAIESNPGVGAVAACDDLSVKPASEAFLITGNWFDVRLAAANRIRGALKAG